MNEKDLLVLVLSLKHLPDDPCSLLMLTNIIYNHVYTGRGRFYRLEFGGLAFIEEHTYHMTF